nr:15458_t:CDS:2 [Entrophospora candida]
METLEATDYSFLTYDPNNTTTKETSTIVPSASALEKKSKPKRSF